jgi:hypothetical protein
VWSLNRTTHKVESVLTCTLPGSEAKEFPLMFYLSDAMDIEVATFNAVRGRDVISSDVMIMGKTDHGQLPIYHILFNHK